MCHTKFVLYTTKYIIIIINYTIKAARYRIFVCSHRYENASTGRMKGTQKKDNNLLFGHYFILTNRLCERQRRGVIDLRDRNSVLLYL